jgi:4-alpha-glucanotransferase
LLVSLERLVDEGWLAADRIKGLPGHEGPADFGAALELKLPLIEEAAANFLDRASEATVARFHKFSQANSSWLPDYAMFNVLRRMHGYVSWAEWEKKYARREQEALTKLMNSHGRQILIEEVVQFFFTEQWCALRSYCSQRDVKILGDVAIFVSYDSADVWTHPEIFELDEDRQPLRVAGVPPDYFSETGQRWGNPLYRWDLLKERGFDWWVGRVRRALALYDIVRLDHFRGFEAYWSIAAEEETAINGQWVKAPGHELFTRLKEVFGGLPFVAEDLGLITPEVDELRERFDMPGMRVLQFGFTDRGSHLYLPHRHVPNTVVYTGTHDNNTTLGWWQQDATDAEKRHVETYLGTVDHEHDVVWAMMRTAARSVANLCIFPLQDVLHLGSEARMNTPAAGAGNWTWRYKMDALHPDFANQLAALMAMTDRDGYHEDVEGEEAGKPVEEASHRAELGTNV